MYTHTDTHRHTHTHKYTLAESLSTASSWLWRLPRRVGVALGVSGPEGITTTCTSPVVGAASPACAESLHDE